MKLVIDTNIFCQDYWQSSINFRLLREGMHLVPAEVKIPEVVVDEVVNRYKEDLLVATETATKANVTLSRLLPPDQQPVAPSVDTDLQAAQFRQWLLTALKDMGAEILPYPDIPHKKVVQRDLERRSPFKKSGAGYRDFRIGKTFVVSRSVV